MSGKKWNHQTITSNQPGPDNTFLDFSNSRGGGTFEFIGDATANSTETLGLLDTNDGANTVRLTGAGGFEANLVFSDITLPEDDSTLNFDIANSNGGNVTFTTYTPGVTADIADPKIYVDGSNFAARTWWPSRGLTR